MFNVDHLPTNLWKPSTQFLAKSHITPPIDDHSSFLLVALSELTLIQPGFKVKENSILKILL